MSDRVFLPEYFRQRTLQQTSWSFYGMPPQHDKETSVALFNKNANRWDIIPIVGTPVNFLGYVIKTSDLPERYSQVVTPWPIVE